MLFRNYRNQTFQIYRIRTQIDKQKNIIINILGILTWNRVLRNGHIKTLNEKLKLQFVYQYPFFNFRSSSSVLTIQPFKLNFACQLAIKIYYFYLLYIFIIEDHYRIELIQGLKISNSQLNKGLQFTIKLPGFQRSEQTNNLNPMISLFKIFLVLSQKYLQLFI
ncbi:unnamed protein product [Paramecium sonneborni]|uniref:Uncharacterized protein n=1 Tax=Paramecium sonneborni TaxID=65129 RepID=A0A8S1RQB3_9CILI|nr:unnamed protein product [Paramecium sonneborni]